MSSQAYVRVIYNRNGKEILVMWLNFCANATNACSCIAIFCWLCCHIFSLHNSGVYHSHMGFMLCNHMTTLRYAVAQSHRLHLGCKQNICKKNNVYLNFIGRAHVRVLIHTEYSWSNFFHMPDQNCVYNVYNAAMNHKIREIMKYIKKYGTQMSFLTHCL